MVPTKQLTDRHPASSARQSKRFFPSAITEKLVPVLLILLVLVLLAVLVITGLSLFGITSSA